VGSTEGFEVDGTAEGFLEGTELGKVDGAFVGVKVGLQDGTMVGYREGDIDGDKVSDVGNTLGLIEGVNDGYTEGLVVGDMDRVGASVGGPEIHVGRPDAAQSGYTQAEGSPLANASSPKPRVAQFGIIAIFKEVQSMNA